MSNPRPDLVARIVADDACPGPTPAPRTGASRLARVASTLMIALLSMFVLSMGVGGQSQSASAVPQPSGIHLPNIPGFPDPMDVVNVASKIPCPTGDTADPGPKAYLSGTTGLMPMQAFGSRQIVEVVAKAMSDPFGSQPHTGFEMYRTSGLVWSRYSPDENPDGSSGCYEISSTIANDIANMVFSMTKVTTEASVGTYQWASSPDLLAGMNDTIDCVVGGKSTGNALCHGPGLRKTLYLEYLTPIIVLGALWGAWVGLVKKRTTEATQGGLWMLCSATFALVFMSQPALIAGFLNGVVSDVNSAVMVGVTQQSSNAVAKEDICYLPKSAPNAGDRMAACSIWKGLAYTPWAAGQFGTPLGVPLPNKDSEKDKYPDLRALQLEAQSMNHDETLLPPGSVTTKDGQQIPNPTNSGGAIYQDRNRYASVAKQIESTPYNRAWTGDDSSERINIAFASVIASSMAGALVMVVSFSTVVLAIGMILLIMMAPMFLLIGAHPGFGRGIALKWAELLIGTVVKRIALGFFLSILIGMYQVILTTPMSWFAQIALILAIGVGAMMFRKPMLEALNVVNLGGSRTGLEGGMGSQQGRKGLSMGAGAVSGAVAGAGGGKGAMLKGAVSGAMMGGRSGSPVRAARMGAGAGRRVASRANTEQAEKQRQADSHRENREQDALDEAQRLDDQERQQQGPSAGPFGPVPRPGGGGTPPPPPAGGAGGGVPRPQSDPDKVREEEEVKREREEARREREASRREREEQTRHREDTTDTLTDIDTRTQRSTQPTPRAGLPTAPGGAPAAPANPDGAQGLPTQRPAANGPGDGGAVPRPGGDPTRRTDGES